MIVSIHQPDYLPYPGYFYKISRSDKFIFLDDAQFSSSNIHNWNVVKSPNGACKIKVPVEAPFPSDINEARTRDELGWKEKHLRTVSGNYSRAPFFKEIFPEFEEVLRAEYKSLAHMNIEINKWICKKFGMKTEFYISSDFAFETVREEKVIDLCVAVGADEYLSGNGARAYQVEEDFTSRGIKLSYTDYKPIKYEQIWGDFLINMSIIDFIFNHGFDWDKIEKAVLAAGTEG